MAVLSRTLLPSTESPTILASTFYAKLYARVTPSFSLCYLRFSIFNSTHLLMVPPRHFSPGSYIITRFFLSLLIRYLILTVSILHFFCSGIAMLSVLFFFFLVSFLSPFSNYGVSLLMLCIAWYFTFCCIFEVLLLQRFCCCFPY